MSKRDELLGLNEFLAHLAKWLIYADMHGRPTIGLLYGHSAAGAFLATALATRVLVGLPGAIAGGDGPAFDGKGDQAVDRGAARRRRSRRRCLRPAWRISPGWARFTPPGTSRSRWPTSWRRCSPDLPDARDRRDALGKERGGRSKAAEIAERVRDLALQAE